MPCVPEAFLSAAHDLRDAKCVADGEARRRTAVGRAYYAVFHKGNDVLRKVDGRARYEYGHKEVIRRLKSSTDKRVQEIATRVEALAHARNCSDYNLRQSVDDRDTSFWVTEADTLIAELPTVAHAIAPE